MHRTAPARTERLVLEPLELHHAPEVLRVSNSNPDFVQATVGGGARSYDLAHIEERLADELHGPVDLAVVPAQREHWLLRQADSGEVVGVLEVGFVHPRDQVPWIALLEVASWHAGKGYGREAAIFVEELAAHRGYSAVGLAVLVANPTALAFWERMGYLQYGAVRGSGLDRAHIMRKRCAPVPTQVEPAQASKPARR